MLRWFCSLVVAAVLVVGAPLTLHAANDTAGSEEASFEVGKKGKKGKGKRKKGKGKKGKKAGKGKKGKKVEAV